MPAPRSSALPAFALAALCAAGGLAVADPSAAPLVLTPGLVADGAQETEIEVSTYGRYAVMVHSLQGAGVQLIDKMTGPGPRAGRAGGEDGRLDVFLDRGRYKLRVDAVEGGKGELRVEVRDFSELHSQPFPVLPELREVEATLGDFEQRSWWIDTRAQRQPVLEVAGRNLADLRLWRDGSWLVDAPPRCAEITPLEGKPMTRCTLSPALEDGLYLLVAYGGPDLPWSEDEDQHPLYLRAGVPTLPEAGRMAETVSAFGADRYLVPKAARFFRLELPKPEPAGLSVRPWQRSAPFSGGGRSAGIQNDSRLPVAELDSSSSDTQLVTVSGTPGQAYVLQHFDATSTAVRVGGEGARWLSTLHAGDPQDSIDATAILVAKPVNAPARVVASDVVQVDGDHGWARRFNLLAPASLYFEVKKEGDYELRSTGTEARFRVEPFFVSRPGDYEPPDWFTGEHAEVTLDPGFYVLNIEPVKPGIAQMQLGWDGWISSMLNTVGMDEGIAAGPVRANTQLPSVNLRSDYSHTLYINQQPGVRVGLVNRELPLDLSDALPLALPPGPGPEVKASFGERGRLMATLEDGTPLKVSVDGGEPALGQAVKAGKHTVVVHNPGEETVLASVVFQPRSRRADAPLEPIAEVELERLPDFPELRADRPEFFDLGAQEATTWQVRVDEPGLYVLASTGLLATEGNLRTRINPSTRRVTENGVGRNFRVAEYLREGDYQLSVAARGLSAGHLGLELVKSPLIEGGSLGDGVPARAALVPGEGLLYTFNVPEDGRYRVRSYGQNGPARCRLEDADGWPVLAPGVEADLEQWLAAGDYRLVVLPSDVEGRRITSIERVEELVQLAGTGPHVLELDQRAHNTWVEPAKGAERAPHVYSFSMPAPASVTLSFSGEMVSELFDAAGERVARSAPGEAWSGTLEPGDYRLEVKNGRRDSGVEYSLSVSPSELIEGLRRVVTAPITVPVSVGREGLVEISSSGREDVRAELLDPYDRVVARSDDRPQDWNFRVVARLDPGPYRLRVLPVGADYAETELQMRAPVEEQQPELRLPMVLSMQPGQAVQLIPLQIKVEDELIAARARSAESVGVAVEALVGGRWVTASQAVGPDTTQLVRLGGEAKAWRLRVWSLDLRGNPVELRVDRVKPSTGREVVLARGLTLRGSSRSVPGVAAARVKLNRPGVFEVSSVDGLLWCPEPAAGCVPVVDATLPVSGEELWLGGVFEDRLGVEAARASLSEDGVGVRLSAEAPVAVDLEGQGGPVLALARASFGQPGARVVQGTEVRRPEAGREGVALGDRAALAVTIGGTDPALVLWPAGGLPEGGMDLRLQQASFPKQEPEPLALGARAVQLAPGEAQAFTLPGGALRLVLSEGLVAVVSEGGAVQSVHFADGRPLEEELAQAAGTLTLLNPGFASGPGAASGPGSAQLSARPSLAQPAPLAFGVTYEARALRPGLTRVLVPEGERDDILHVRGARAVRLLTEDGVAHQGEDIPVGRGGELLIEHEAGLLFAWVSRETLDGEGLWGTAELGDAQPVALPGLVSLSGSQQSLRLDLPAAGLLSLRAPAAMVLAVREPSGLERVYALPESGVLDLWLPAGSSELHMRGVAGVPLWGEAELSLSQPAPLAEGLGPEILMGSGSSAVYSFTVTRDGQVGYGVRATAERVVATLLDAEGEPISAGALGMAHLSAGDYLLVLHLPPEAAPVRARPALVGVEPPDTGPPEEVVRGYMPSRGGAR